MLSLIAFVLTLLTICGGAFSPAAARQASREGAGMALRRGSYYVKPWVLYESRDPLRAVHGRAGVDAVIVETPFERVRYEAYLYTLQGTRITPALIERWRSEAARSFGFLVYAHSRSQGDRTFLNGFSRAGVVLSNGQTRWDTQALPFGPSDDFYDVGTFREERWTGSITYRFELAACNERGVVRFHDRYGNAYALPFDLTRFH